MFKIAIKNFIGISLKCYDQLFSICMGSYYCPPNRPLSVVECPVESRCYVSKNTIRY